MTIHVSSFGDDIKIFNLRPFIDVTPCLLCLLASWPPRERRTLMGSLFQSSMFSCLCQKTFSNSSFPRLLPTNFHNLAVIYPFSLISPQLFSPDSHSFFCLENPFPVLTSNSRGQWSCLIYGKDHEWLRFLHRYSSMNKYLLIQILLARVAPLLGRLLWFFHLELTSTCKLCDL